MDKNYEVIFKEEVIKDINRQKKDIRDLVKNSSRKIELLGPLAGNLINKYSLYEIN